MPAAVSSLLAPAQAPAAAARRSARSASGLSARRAASSGAAVRLQQKAAAPALRRRDVNAAVGVRTRAALAEPPAATTPEILSPQDYEIWPAEKVKGRPRVLVLGSGWAAVAFIKNLDPEHYSAALISPRNYFLCVSSPVRFAFFRAVHLVPLRLLRRS